MAKSKEEIEREERERAEAERQRRPQQPAATRAEQTKAEKARAEALGARRYVVNHAGVGAHLRGKVVERGEIANFTRDPRRPATDEEINAGIARLIDKGAISPAPDEDDEAE